MFLHPQICRIETFREIPKLGEATVGEAVTECRYLIMPKEAFVTWREVRLQEGGSRFVADHENNPDSVIFSPGGVVNSAKAVIQGEVSRLANREFATRVFLILTKLIKHNFSPIGAYRVGPEALSFGQRGFRLTASIHSPVEYDLSIPAIHPANPNP